MTVVIVKRRYGSQKNRATTAGSAAIIACQHYNVVMAMDIADLFNDDDVYNARLNAAAAAAASSSSHDELSHCDILSYLLRM